MKKKGKKEDKFVIYQTKSGAIELREDTSKETVWASQAQMAEMFGVNSQAITKHIKNIYKDKELTRKSTCSKMEQVRQEGKRTVRRSIDIYNLDVMIAVGYRINSVVGTKFRQWATKTLREHITKGYTLDRKRIGRNYQSFIDDVAHVQSLLPENVTYNPKDVLELIKAFADTWVSLGAYDSGALSGKGVTKKKVHLTAEELLKAISTLKSELLKKKEATEIFAHERTQGTVEGIVGNIVQSFGGNELYPTIEEKAGHLLYFIVKNHPFTDGNKRSGAFAFIWYLDKAKAKGIHKLNPSALTTLTLLIAESDPKEKEKMLELIVSLIGGKR